MSNELAHEQAIELLPAYVLGALEPNEMLAMEGYLRQQRDLLTQLESLEETTAYLAHVAPASPLPARNKARLMSRVRADLHSERLLHELEGRSEGQAEKRRPVARALKQDNQSAAGWRAIVPQRLWQGTTALAIAALLLLVLYTREAQQALGNAENRLIALEEVNQRLVEQSELYQQRFAIVTTARRTIMLPGTEAAPEAQGAFYQSGNEGLLVWHGLEPLSAEQDYELWFIPVAGDPVPAGVFDVTDVVAPATLVAVPLDLEYTAVAVSVEPRGGSPQPTGPIVLLGDTAARNPES